LPPIPAFIIGKEPDVRLIACFNDHEDVEKNNSIHLTRPESEGEEHETGFHREEDDDDVTNGADDDVAVRKNPKSSNADPESHLIRSQRIRNRSESTRQAEERSADRDKEPETLEEHERVVLWPFVEQLSRFADPHLLHAPNVDESLHLCLTR
jgi:hypothetical protein